MATKIEINTIVEVLQKNIQDNQTIRNIVQELTQTNEQKEANEEKEPKEKKQFVILISDPEGRLAGLDFAGWVLQIPESESPATTVDRINRSAYDFNCTKKGRMLPAKTHGEALENIPAKIFKENQLWVKTKTPVLAATTNNLIPRFETKA
jgi:hypothetical protein